MKQLTGAVLACAMAMAADAQGGRIDPQAEVAAVLFAASATQAALAKSLDAKLQAQRERIAHLATELKSGDTQHRAEMIAAQESFVTELAARDREYAAQIAVFRSTVNDIAATPDGAQALERFNTGDEAGALSILDKLRASNEKMRAEKLRLEDAAEARRIARLALEARTRGKVTIDAVIGRYEEVVRLDPGVASDWAQLKRMYVEIGKLPEARKAVDSMAAAARDDRERDDALEERADVLVHQGDLVGARKAAEAALKLSRRLLAESSGDGDVEMMFSASLQEFGEVARRQGDLATAESAYREEVAYSRTRASLPSASDADRHRLASDLLHLGDTLIQRGEMRRARDAIEENISLLRTLQAKTPDNIKYAREIAVSSMWLSDVLVSIGEFSEAHLAQETIIVTATRLSAAESNNVVFRGDLGLGLLKKATLLAIEGQFDASARNFELARSIFHDLAEAPGAAVELRVNEGSGLMGLADEHLLLQDPGTSKRFAEAGVALYRKLAAADATDVTSREFLAEALYSLAAALMAGREFEASRKAIEEGEAIDEGLLKGGFNSSDVEFDLSAGQLLMGNLLNAQSRTKEALVPLSHSLQTRRRLAAAQPGSSYLSRGVAETMRSLVAVPGSPLSWAEFAQYLRSMHSHGVFWPRDQGWLDEARQHTEGT